MIATSGITRRRHVAVTKNGDAAVQIHPDKTSQRGPRHLLRIYHTAASGTPAPAHVHYPNIAFRGERLEEQALSVGREFGYDLAKPFRWHAQQEARCTAFKGHRPEVMSGKKPRATRPARVHVDDVRRRAPRHR